MVLGRQSIGAGVLAMLLAGAGSAGAGQQAQQQTTQTPEQGTNESAQNQSLPSAPSSALPNAPTPQTLPQLNTITPPAPMAPRRCRIECAGCG